jgi:hypothetical protein
VKPNGWLNRICRFFEASVTSPWHFRVPLIWKRLIVTRLKLAFSLIIIHLAATFVFAYGIQLTQQTEANTKQTEKEQKLKAKQAEKERKEKEKQEAKIAKERAKAEAKALRDRVPILSEYDRFQNIGTLYFLWRTVDIGSYGYFELFFGASYVYSGAEITAGGRTLLLLQYNRYGSFSELPNHHLELIADGERMDLGEFAVTNRETIAARSIRVTVGSVIPYETLVKLGNAKLVEGRIGGVEFVLKDKIVVAIHDLAERVPR